MSERDELAAIIDDRWHGYGYNPLGAADAAIAAGWRKPRTVTTVEELDALGFQTVVLDAENYVLERWGQPEEKMWATPMNSAWIRSSEIALPATVLHEGEA